MIVTPALLTTGWTSLRERTDAALLVTMPVIGGLSSEKCVELRLDPQLETLIAIFFTWSARMVGHGELLF